MCAHKLLVPRIDVNATKLQLFHDILQWRKPACYVFRLIGESFQESMAVLLAVEPHDERFERKRRNPVLFFKKKTSCQKKIGNQMEVGPRTCAHAGRRCL
jgi:hypothetical protein